MEKLYDTKYEGATVQECLSKASVSLGVPVENLKYSIIEEKKGLFKKYASIVIHAIETSAAIGELDYEHITKEEDGTIEINEGRIIIKNPKESGRPAAISVSESIDLIVNGEKVSSPTLVYKESIIEVLLPKEEAKRYMNLKISDDNMEAYISISYKPSTIYKLKDTIPLNSHVIQLDEKEKIIPPKFTEAEIKDELLKQNITHGILKMNLMKCSQSEETSQLLIATGKRTIDGIDDNLEIKYSMTEQQNDKLDDSIRSIDFKAIGSVEGVEKGQVLGILHPGKDGVDGVDIRGRIVKAKTSKKIALTVGEGAQLLNEQTAVAANEGRPSLRGSTFFVYKLHEVTGDVGLKTGNITFVGDVTISGSVNEGMKVEAGNSILVKQNVTDADIIANGDVVVKGNVIHSNVSAGKEDVLTLEYLSDLNSMKSDLLKLISSITQLKEMNLLQRNIKDGELIKTLLETKFKKLPQTSLKVAKRILTKQQDGDELVFIIKHKLLDLGPLNIDRYEELNDAVIIIDNKISRLMLNLTLPVDVMLDYCQDSVIKSSGNVIFTGKGQYVSQIVASDSVIFKQDRSVARGGVIKAAKEIRAKIVGGLGGVSTKLVVENHGHIWAEIAYANTRFIVGAKEYVLDVASKNVHVFLDEKRELIVDKLLL